MNRHRIEINHDYRKLKYSIKYSIFKKCFTNLPFQINEVTFSLQYTICTGAVGVGVSYSYSYSANTMIEPLAFGRYTLQNENIYRIRLWELNTSEFWFLKYRVCHEWNSKFCWETSFLGKCCMQSMLLVTSANLNMTEMKVSPHSWGLRTLSVCWCLYLGPLESPSHRL